MDARMITRTVALVLALVNTGFSLFGWNPIPVDEEAIYKFISLAILGYTTFISWHKNNPTSKAGKKAQQDLHKYKKEIKESKVSDALPETNESILGDDNKGGL